MLGAGIFNNVEWRILLRLIGLAKVLSYSAAKIG